MIEIAPHIPLDLFSTFNNVKFDDDSHSYVVNEKKLTSVTTLLHHYQENFDEDYWSAYKANEFNVPQDEVLEAWKFINIKGTTKGSLIHNYAEFLFNNKIYPYQSDHVKKVFGFDPIKTEYDKTKKLIDKFYKDSFGKIIPIRTEMVMYDEEYLIGGMADMLVYNIKAREFQIWDYKTNNKFSKFSEKSRKLLKNLCMLDDCDLEIYSLQLDAYKHIIEKNTSLKLGKSYLVWVSSENDNYEIIETKDRSVYVKMIFDEHKFSIAA